VDVRYYFVLSGVLTVKAKYLFPSLSAIGGRGYITCLLHLLKVLLLQWLSEKKIGILSNFCGISCFLMS
jgi:hypothetical protein